MTKLRNKLGKIGLGLAGLSMSLGLVVGELGNEDLRQKVSVSLNEAEDTKIQEKTQIEKFYTKIEPDKIYSDDPLYLLTFSDSISEQYFEYGKTDKLKGNNLDEALRFHQAYCLENAVVTYSNFIDLAKRNNHPELLNRIRLAVGAIKVDKEYKDKKKGSFTHAWIEFKQKGEWKVYEANLPLGEYRVVNPEGIIYTSAITGRIGTNNQIEIESNWKNGTVLSMEVLLGLRKTN